MNGKHLLAFTIVITIPAISFAATFYLINKTGFDIQCKVGAGEEKTFGINKVVFEGTIKNNSSQWVDSGLASKIVVIAKSGNKQILEASTPLSLSDRFKTTKQYFIYGPGVCEQNITTNNSDVRSAFSSNYPQWFFEFKQ